jgi:hypothetical protein
MNQYIDDFQDDMTERSAATHGKAGNGAFIHSCHTHVIPKATRIILPSRCTLHTACSSLRITAAAAAPCPQCEAQGDAFFEFAVDGVTMQQAVSKWWNSDGADPASAHTYAPCHYKGGASGPRKCNPTCSSGN